MNFREFCETIDEVKTRWEKICVDVQKQTGRSPGCRLVVTNPDYRLADDKKRPEAEREEYPMGRMQVEIEEAKPWNRAFFSHFEWLGNSDHIKPFAVELRFKGIDRDLIRAIRNHPLIREIEGQKNLNDASIRVFLYTYKGGWNN